MSEAAIEDDVYDFLRDAIDAAEAVAPDPPADGLPWLFDPNNPLAGAELHDHVYQDIKTEYGIRIGDAESTLAPGPGATEMEEFDGSMPLIVFSEITGPNRADRKGARLRMMKLVKAVALLFIDQNGVTLGDRVNDARITNGPRGWDVLKSKPYAVTEMHLIVNDSGAE